MRRRVKRCRKSQESLKTLKLRFVKRTLKFTETVIVWLAVIYFLNWIVSVALILLAIEHTTNFAYLDTLITETGTTFRDIVGIAIIKFGIENIFKYNDFGGKIPNKNEEDCELEEDTTETYEDEQGGISG